MMRFQRAYEANARFFTVVNQTLDVAAQSGPLGGASHARHFRIDLPQRPASTSTAPPRQLARRQREVSSGRRIDAAERRPVGDGRRRWPSRPRWPTLDQFTQATDSVDSRLTVVDTRLTDIINQITNAQTRAAGGRSIDPDADAARRARRRDSRRARAPS